MAASTKPYYRVFFALMILTVVTVLAAYLNLGSANPLVAMVIAAGKAMLVGWYFMHLRQADGLVRVFITASVFWIVVLMVLTVSDVATRPWMPDARPWLTPQREVQAQHWTQSAAESRPADSSLRR